MMTLEFATQLHETKAIAGRPDFALASGHTAIRFG